MMAKYGLRAFQCRTDASAAVSVLRLKPAGVNFVQPRERDPDGKADHTGDQEPAGRVGGQAERGRQLRYAMR